MIKLENLPSPLDNVLSSVLQKIFYKSYFAEKSVLGDTDKTTQLMLDYLFSLRKQAYQLFLDKVRQCAFF